MMDIGNFNHKKTVTNQVYRRNIFLFLCFLNLLILLYVLIEELFGYTQIV